MTGARIHAVATAIVAGVPLLFVTSLFVLVAGRAFGAANVVLSPLVDDPPSGPPPLAIAVLVCAVLASAAPLAWSIVATREAIGARRWDESRAANVFWTGWCILVAWVMFDPGGRVAWFVD